MDRAPEGVPLVSCHRLLEPGNSYPATFFRHFCLAKVIFKSQKQFLILGNFYFWSSCYFLELLMGSSIWWRELSETPSRALAPARAGLAEAGVIHLTGLLYLLVSCQ